MPHKSFVEKIISGGQTGADRGGLDAAIALGIPHGGWCPKGRRAEDGAIPRRYKLYELASWDYSVRTLHNVIDSNATIVFCLGVLDQGSRLTIADARLVGRPCLWPASVSNAATLGRVKAFLKKHRPAVLNIAGSRESKARGIQAHVRDLLVEALQ